MTPSLRLTLAVAAGGAVGASARYGIGLTVPGPGSFPWTTLGINVAGSFLLALLPALTLVRRSTAWTLALGPGLLGGFTTLSAYAEQTRVLLAEDRAVAAGAYVVATLVVCLLAVLLAGELTRPAQRALRGPDRDDGPDAADGRVE